MIYPARVIGLITKDAAHTSTLKCSHGIGVWLHKNPVVLGE